MMSKLDAGSLRPDAVKDKVLEHFPNRIVTVDSHTAGEPTRLIFGYEDLPGKSMPEKRLNAMTRLDHLRLPLTREPRGHRNMFGALVTEPVAAEADFGLIFMDARRYAYLCGHAIMGAVVTLIDLGILSKVDGENRIVVDTPSGRVPVSAKVTSGKVESVAMEMVPSFVLATGCPLKLPQLGEIRVDLVYVGGFFTMVDTDQMNIPLTPENHARLADLGMAVIEAANGQLTVNHPLRAEVNTVDVVEFYDSSRDDGRRGKSIVILGEGHLDRSPCGTGTAAKMTLLHRKGRLELHQPYVNTGPLGTVFQGRLVDETVVGEYPAVVAEIAGSAQITGLHQFVVDPRDPFPQGFLL